MALALVLTADPVAASRPCPVLEAGVDPLTPALVPIVVAALLVDVVPEAEGRPMDVVLATLALTALAVGPPALPADAGT
jgi:hypothetical protein